jgi:hypothetical protein
MQPYQDPGGAFSIDYPKAWKVRSAENGYTVFYQDDPEEGTLFGIFPKLVLDGEATAAQIVDALLQEIRKRYPDFEVKDRKIEPAPEGGEFVFVKARWTNGRNEFMTTVLVLHVDRSEGGRTVLLLVNLQAPEVAFSAVEPTFSHMFKSLR